MQPLLPTRLIQEGFTLLPVDFDVCASNVLSVLIEGNHRTGTVPSVPLYAVTQNGEQIDGLYEWMEKTLAAHGPMTHFEPEVNTEGGDRALGIQLTPGQRQILGALTGAPRVIPDYSEMLHELLVHGKAPFCDTNGLTLANTEYVAFPATGYPRRYHYTSVGTPEAGAIFTRLPKKPKSEKEASATNGTGPSTKISYLDRAERVTADLFRLPGPGCNWSRNWGKICIALSWQKFVPSLIPGLANSTIEGFSVRDRSIGEVLMKREQLRALAGVLYIFPFQASLMKLHCHRRLMDALIARAKEEYPASGYVIEEYEKARAFLLSLPVHTLFTPVISAMQTGRISTYFGDRDTWYAQYMPSEAEDKELNLVELLMREVHSSVTAQPAGWKNIHDMNTMNGPLFSVPTLARAVKESNLVQEMQTAATKLGWRTISASIDMINFAGADFILTDGRGFSSVPSQALLGMSPTLSVGNRQLLGLARRFDDNFNTKDNRIKYSVVPVKGYVTAPNSALRYERGYMPSGMSMGEDGLLMISAVTEQDAMAQKVLQHYRDHNDSTYVRDRYVRPDVNSGLKSVTFSDWDTYVTAHDADIAKTQLLEAYKGQTEMVPPQGQKFMNLRRGDIMLVFSDQGFNLRMPVRMARWHRIVQYNADMIWTEMQEADGHVVYNNEASVTQSADALQAIVDMAEPAGPTSRSMSELTIESEDKVDQLT